MKILLSVLSVSVLSVLLFAMPARQSVAADEPPLFTLDDEVWVLFYDLPSRRFRAIRDAFVSRRFESAQRDLLVSEGFMRAEIGRANASLLPPMSEVAGRLNTIATDIDSAGLTVRDLDPVFARAHWLLGQHYLTLAAQSRDAGRHVSAGNYLWATAHHLERAVLWSDARITRQLQKSLDGMREIADALRTSAQPQRVYRDKPIDNAGQILLELGQFLDRKVWIEPPKK